MKKVKNSIFYLLTALIAFASCKSLNTSTEETGSLLWKIEGKGIKPSYLMGTFHMLPKEDFILKDKVKDAFNSSEQIVLELDMDDASMQAEMMKHIMLKDGENLKDFMTEDESKLLDKELKEKFGQGLDQLGMMKPLAITSMVTMNLMGEQPASFERTFVNMAKEQNKEILGLETVAEQMSVFDNIPNEEQLDQIIEMLENKEVTNQFFEAFIETYKAEDLNGLYTQLSEQMGSVDQQKLLLDDRNENWIPKIGNMATDKSTFFGVGAGHLPGKKGVISLLRDAGYKVTPVKG